MSWSLLFKVCHHGKIDLILVQTGVPSEAKDIILIQIIFISCHTSNRILSKKNMKKGNSLLHVQGNFFFITICFIFIDLACGINMLVYL